MPKIDVQKNRTTSRNKIVRERIEVRGIVQGVGFRPFVFRLAHKHKLSGLVTNTVHGVGIEVQGSRTSLDLFTTDLALQPPPMASVSEIRRKKIEPLDDTGFSIDSSGGGEGRTVPVAADSGVCDDCLGEMRDKSDRRWRYPFINCTNCGPRYTIVRDIPYDRPNTTMHSFKMCPSCRAEYENPLDRRFHAQPVACPDCGPRVWLTDVDGNELKADLGRDIIQIAGKLLRNGSILAVKGLGGFHLACDATSSEAVTTLRSRKKRQGKPFAVMFSDTQSVAMVCRMTEIARQSLESPRKPIVLLKKKERSGIKLADAVSPGMDEHGVMLPYTPLHYLLIEAADNVPLVMTSGNLSDEPIVIDNETALTELSDVADYFLLHDRGIHMRNDDSVLRPVGRRVFPVRRSRGYAPEPLRLKKDMPPVLAVGGQLKNTICLTRGRDAYLSQHVGDLDGLDSYQFFSQTVEQMLRLFELEPDRVAADMHPAYLTTRWAADSGFRIVPVQHHHAHVVSCMAENGISGKVLGVTMDGTGYGTDGTIWGGEFLAADEREFTRLGHLPGQHLPGGDTAIRQTWRTARSVFGRALGFDKLDSLDIAAWEGIDPGAIRTVDRMLTEGVNCPVSTGCGRLFDAVAALVGICKESLYEGQAAVELEGLASRADRRTTKCYDYELNKHTGLLVPDLDPMFTGIAEDCASGVAPRQIARGFHETLVDVIINSAEKLGRQNELDRIVLSGGVFNNKLISNGVEKGLRKHGLRVYSHRRVPPGDGGISLGQAVIAANN